jgi:emfourin
MIIKVERSGGLSGIQISNEMDSKDLPSILRKKIKKILSESNGVLSPPKSKSSHAADQYIYKISIYDEKNQRMIMCDEFNIQKDLKSIVKYLEMKSKK